MPGEQSDSGVGVYLFAFARIPALPPVEGPRLEEPYPIQVRVAGEIAAVFTQVILGPWTGPLSGENLAWVAKRVLVHEEVIEQIMKSSPVLPVRFGTLFSSEESLGAMMTKGHDMISAFLDSVAGKEEWAVKVWLDRETAVEHLLAPVASPGKVPAANPGLHYLRRQHQRAEMSKKIGPWVKEVGESLAARMDSLAVASRSLRTSGRDKEMAFNWAFLLAQDRRDRFQACVREIAEELDGQGLSLEMSGPWPPYSFCPSLDFDKDFDKQSETRP